VPMIDVTLPEGALTSEQRDALADQLTTTLLKWEGAAEIPFSREITLVYFDERPADAIYVAGQRVEEPRYRLLVTIPAGSIKEDQRKARLVDELTRQVMEAEGSDPEEASFRVWTFIHEVPDGHWAGDGRIFRFRDIVKLALSGGETKPERPTVTA
jgi:phenylpyruvate tautomerase PptA (4-oxalocrotonate tautomerase family)